jgi:hypothetical protein
MRIAFDLDDTLIPSTADLFPVERPRGVFGRFLASEWLRRGAPDLMHALKGHRCDVWVYTTSSRSQRYITGLFRWYGVRLGGAINQEIHWEWLKQQDPGRRCSKYPPAFGIDLLIDDSEGVWMEGQQFGFRVVHVRPDDPDWVQTVVTEVNKNLSSPLVLGRLEADTW